jgi:hypothetical protein
MQFIKITQRERGRERERERAIDLGCHESGVTRVGSKGAVKAPLFNLSTDSCLKTTSNFEQFFIGIFTNVTHTRTQR